MDYVSGYIGTYTQGKGRGEGIYTFKLHTGSGRIEALCVAAYTVNPSYIALSPSKKYVYGTNEIDAFEGNPSGAVSAFAVEGGTGKLTLLNQKLSQGKSPCHIAINREGTHGVIANYMSGTLGVFPLEPDGRLGDPVQVIQCTGRGPNHDRQEASHIHFFMFDSPNTYGFAYDLGADKIRAYSFDKQRAIPLVPGVTPTFSAKPGSGPRHGVFHPQGTVGYAVNELDSTIDSFHYDGHGVFEKIQRIATLPQGGDGCNTPAAIKISADGKFLYASNRGHDSITLYKIYYRGILEFIDALPSGGKTPRDFTIDPTGRFLLVCHQDSDNLVVFRIDPGTGLFKKIGEYEVPSGVCIIFS